MTKRSVGLKSEMDYTTGILSRISHTELINQSAEQLIKYSVYLLKLEKWHYERGLIFPNTAVTNYKDAMFHYKKICEHNDMIKVLQEQYAMEEHLIRAHKDAIINYLIFMLQGIEGIYFLFSDNSFLRSLPAINDLEKTLEDNGLIEDYKEIDFDDSNWIMSFIEIIKNVYSSREEGIRYSIAVYYHHKQDFNSIIKELQKCIHQIKNYLLKLRINGTEIYRPMNDDDYNTECVKVFSSVKKCLDNMSLGMSLAVMPVLYYQNDNNDFKRTQEEDKVFERNKVINDYLENYSRV